MRRLGARDPGDGALRPMDGEILVDDHARVVVSNRGDPDEALVLDVLDDESELVHVGAEHHRRHAIPAGAGEVLIPERVGRVLVVVAVELLCDDLGDQALVSRDPDGGVEGGEQVKHRV